MIVVLAEIDKEEDLKLIWIKSVEIMALVTLNDNARFRSFEDELTGVDMSAVDTNGDGEIVIADEREYVAWEY
jgi:hypothetical protein